MKVLSNLLISIVVVLISSLSIQAQEIYEIDLGKNENDVVKKTIPHGKDFQILIKNKLPRDSISYELEIVREIQLNEKLNLENKVKDNLKSESIGCHALSDLMSKIDSTKTEKELAKYTSELEKSLNNYKHMNSSQNNKLEECTLEQVQLAKEIIERTKETCFVNQLKQNEQVIIIISREDKDKKIVWKHILKTQKKGKWLTTYGFTYINNIFKKGEPFFAKQVDSTFAITPLSQRSRLSFVPSIFFTWFPYKDINKNLSHSFTGGLGYDLEAPTAFLGYSLLYNQNIGVSIGLAAHQQDFLNGRYEEDDILMENLAEEQLNEKLYTINPFISVTFRFGSAPFKDATADTSIEE